MIRAFENKNKSDSNIQQKSTNKIINVLPINHVAIHVYERYIMVRKEDTIIANIEKTPKDIPVYHWSYNRNTNSSTIDLLV